MTPTRSDRYLAFVRKQTCVFCHAPEPQAHHHGRSGKGVGVKGCDLLTVPLCPRHHGEWHQHARIEPYDRNETQAYIWRGIAETMRRFILENAVDVL